MELSRRHVLGLLAASAVAGCSGGGPGDSNDDGDTGGSTTVSGQEPGGGLPADDSNDSGETALSGSCASLFGDTLATYDTSDRGMIATFSYPMGGEVLFEQSDDVDHRTSFGYGRGDISALHDLTVTERGPIGDTGDATEAYAFSEDYESGTVTTFGGQERPAAIRRTDDTSVTYIFRVEGPDGFYEFSIQTAVGEGDPCPETYESVTRRVAESFEPLA